MDEDDCGINDELDCVIEELEYWLLEEELTDEELATDADDFTVNEELDNIAELESFMDELDCSDSDEKLSDDENPIAEELNAVVELESFSAELEESPSTSTIVE